MKLSLIRLPGLLSLAGILMLCFFTWFSGDDICYQNELSRYSVLEKAWLQYNYWDGRSLSIASLLQLAGLKYFPAPLITLIWAVSFIGAAFMILKIAGMEQRSSQRKPVSFNELSVMVAVLWLGMWKLIPDIIYWSTGGWYSMMLLLSLVWIYIFQKGLKYKWYSTGGSAVIFITSLLCGNNSHNVIIPLLLVAVIEMSHAIAVRKEKKALGYGLSAIAGLILSAYFVLFAPGNYERLHAIAWKGFNASFLYYFTNVIVKYCYWLLVLWGLLVYFILLNGKNPGTTVAKFFRSGPGNVGLNKSSIVTMLHAHKYLIAAISSVVVFSATSFFAVPRTAIFFASFIVLYFLDRFHLTFDPNRSKKLNYGCQAFLILFISILAFEMNQAISLQKEIAARERIYQEQKNKNVEVASIGVSKIPFAFSFTDISKDTSYWVNRCVALHYGLKTVSTRD